MQRQTIDSGNVFVIASSNPVSQRVHVDKRIHIVQPPVLPPFCVFDFAPPDGGRHLVCLIADNHLKFNQYIGFIEKSGYLVKVDIAQKQLAEEAAKRQAEADAAARLGGSSTVPTNASGDGGYVYTPPTEDNAIREDNTPSVPTPKNRRFFMSADLDTTRINRDVQKYVEEIIQHLTSVDGASITVSLEVQAVSADGFTQQTVRTISENCRTLRVRDSGFEE